MMRCGQISKLCVFVETNLALKPFHIPLTLPWLELP
jgi:hypothetical protein